MQMTALKISVRVQLLQLSNYLGRKQNSEQADGFESQEAKNFILQEMEEQV